MLYTRTRSLLKRCPDHALKQNTIDYDPMTLKLVHQK